MDFLVQAILPYIILYKYWALFVVTFLAALAIPIPSGTLLITSSAFASQGYFKITTILFVVFVANIIGDNLSYLIARRYGKKILSHISFMRKIFDSYNYSLVEKSINKRPGAIIIISRFEVISNLTLNFICGISNVSYRKFLLYEIIGTVCNVLFYAFIGYTFAGSWQAVDKIIGNFTIVFFALILILITLFWKKIFEKLNRLVNSDSKSI
jgi:membrane protein DedA with SNARE-associated domain